jgi:hypothetical protein
VDNVACHTALCVFVLFFWLLDRVGRQPPEERKNTMVDSWKLFKVVTLMVAWYITSIAAGVYNKEFLNLYELPMVLTLCQSFAGVVFGLVVLSSMGQLQFLQSMYELSTLGLLGAVHVVGTVLTNISTGKSSASFTHTVKVCVPSTPPSYSSLFFFFFFFFSCSRARG